MMASESKDDKQIVEAVKSIIKSCTFDKVDVDNIPMFDLEYIFIKLRVQNQLGKLQKSQSLAPMMKKQKR